MLIMTAEVQLQIEATRAEINEPPPEVCERTAQQFEKLQQKHDRRDEWQSVLRGLDRTDTSYRN
jgi:hypothetical protein